MTACPFRIIDENDRMLVVDKPCGQATVPARGEPPERSLWRQAERRTGSRLYAVHRIDRDTSGLVAFAKSAAAHRELCALFESGRVQKTYLALASGRIPRAGRVESPIRAFGSGRMAVDSRGKPSRTSYRPREHFLDSTLVEIEPKTGRRHQIRVHLYSIGHPVVGDPLYGRPPAAPRLMLHAWRLRLTLPGGREISACCEPPCEFLRELDRRRPRAA